MESKYSNNSGAIMLQMSSRCQSLAIKHYMLKPIQRIPQYRMLLQGNDTAICWLMALYQLWPFVTFKKTFYTSNVSVQSHKLVDFLKTQRTNICWSHIHR